MFNKLGILLRDWTKFLKPSKHLCRWVPVAVLSVVVLYITLSVDTLNFSGNWTETVTRPPRSGTGFKMNSATFNEQRALKPRCALTGWDAVGTWSNHSDFGFRFEVDHCELKRYSAQDARACLAKNSPMVFMEQSVLRYQYLSLAHFVTHGEMPSHCIQDPIARESQKENGRVFDWMPKALLHNVHGDASDAAVGWSHFFSASNKQLNTKSSTEVCNCGRPEGYKNPFVENRYCTHTQATSELEIFSLLSELGMLWATLGSNRTRRRNRDSLYSRKGVVPHARIYVPRVAFEIEL